MRYSRGGMRGWYARGVRKNDSAERPELLDVSMAISRLIPTRKGKKATYEEKSIGEECVDEDEGP